MEGIVPVLTKLILGGNMIFIDYSFIKKAVVLIISFIIVPLYFWHFGTTEETTLAKAILDGKKIVLDPGHGGADPGAVVGKIKEAELNMKLALILKTKLEGYGAEIVMTRNGDVGLVPGKRMSYFEQWLILQKRKLYALLQDGDILISIHSNSNEDSRASGPMVFYSDDKSRSLAENIQDNLNSLGLRPRKAAKSGFTVIKGASIPAVLVEAGFITNKKDRKLLLEKPELIAEQITKGILEFEVPVGTVSEESNDRLSYTPGLLY